MGEKRYTPILPLRFLKSMKIFIWLVYKCWCASCWVNPRKCDTWPFPDFGILREFKKLAFNVTTYNHLRFCCWRLTDVKKNLWKGLTSAAAFEYQIWSLYIDLESEAPIGRGPRLRGPMIGCKWRPSYYFPQLNPFNGRGLKLSLVHVSLRRL